MRSIVQLGGDLRGSVSGQDKTCLHGILRTELVWDNRSHLNDMRPSKKRRKGGHCVGKSGMKPPLQLMNLVPLQGLGDFASFLEE